MNHDMETKPPSIQSKVEHSVDYEEDARSESDVEDYGRGNGSFMTAYFNVTCVSHHSPYGHRTLTFSF